MMQIAETFALNIELSLLDKWKPHSVVKPTYGKLTRMKIIDMISGFTFDKIVTTDVDCHRMTKLSQWMLTVIG